MVEGGGEPVSLGSLLTDSLKSGTGPSSWSGRSASSSGPASAGPASMNATSNNEEAPSNGVIIGSSGSMGTRSTSDGGSTKKRRRRNHLRERKAAHDATNRRVRTGVSVPQLVRQLENTQLLFLFIIWLLFENRPAISFCNYKENLKINSNTRMLDTLFSDDFIDIMEQYFHY